MSTINVSHFIVTLREIGTYILGRLGLGAPLPQKRPDGAANRSELDSNNRLRKHLLGSDRRKASDQTQTQTHHRTHSKGNASRRPPESASDPDFDFEESRSSLGKRKRKRALEETDTVARSKTHEANDAPDTNKGDRNRGNSYLDELLSKRSRKKAGKDKSL